MQNSIREKTLLIMEHFDMGVSRGFSDVVLNWGSCKRLKIKKLKTLKKIEL